ncbi:hypothetical protein [Corynebacterium accolens]|uniref:hypothetical protein n=1 Tax=Corynebacterium accolens TaxID=38284 RepID=UPI003080E660
MTYGSHDIVTIDGKYYEARFEHQSDSNNGPLGGLGTFHWKQVDKPGLSGSTPSQPPTQGGQDRGKFELGVTYQAGDIVTIKSGEYPAAAAEGTYRALVTHESSFYHYPWNDPRTWERID